MSLCMFGVDFSVVTIPVPWGHIAGKAWGKPSGLPVLAVHGKALES